MPRRTARGAARYIHRDASSAEYAHVEIELTPGGHWEPAEIDGQAWFFGIPRRFVATIQSTLRHLLVQRFGILGLDKVGVSLTLASYHELESTEAAFARATALAFRDALAKSGIVRVTSKLRVLLSVPAAHERTVVAELFERQAQPELRTRVGERVQLVAKAPLVSLLGFETWLRAASGGSGTVQLRFAGFQPVGVLDIDDDDEGQPAAQGARLRGPRPSLRYGIALAEPEEDLEPVGVGRVMRVGAPS
jgi:elongation factor G